MPNKCEQLYKRQESESLDGLIAPVNITDVNDDCLEHILKKLSLDDLLNVADSCKRLMQAARLAYASKYGRKRVQKRQKNRFYSSAKKYIEKCADIEIFDISLMLRFMRCFGPSISKLSLPHLDISERQRNELDRYLDEYCAASVINLISGGDTFKNLTNQFPKVETLDFRSRQFGFPSTLLTRFPNVRTLKLYDWIENGSIVARFPHLEHLVVGSREKTAQKNLENFLRMNQQLRSLALFPNRSDLNLLQAVSECSQLESLALYGYYLPTNSEVDPIHFKSVKELQIASWLLKDLASSNVTIVFDQLEELEIGVNLEQCDIDFISKHPSVSKFNGKWISKNGPISRLIKALPSVTDVKLTFVLPDQAIEFVNECESLKRFSFILDSDTKFTDYDDLQKRLGKEWKSSIESNNVTLER